MASCSICLLRLATQECMLHGGYCTVAASCLSSRVWLLCCQPVATFAVGALVGSWRRFVLDESLLLTGLVPAKSCSQLI